MGPCLLFLFPWCRINLKCSHQYLELGAKYLVLVESDVRSWALRLHVRAVSHTPVLGFPSVRWQVPSHSRVYRKLRRCTGNAEHGRSWPSHPLYMFVQSIFSSAASFFPVKFLTCYLTQSPSQRSSISLSTKAKGSYVISFPSSIISMTCFHTCFPHSSFSSDTGPLAVSVPGPLHVPVPLPEMLHSHQWTSLFKFVINVTKGKIIVLLKKIHFFFFERRCQNDSKLYYLTEIAILCKSTSGKKRKRNPRFHSWNCKPGENHAGDPGISSPSPHWGGQREDRRKSAENFFYCFSLEVTLLFLLLVRNSG